MTPVPIRAAPAKSEKSKEKFPDLCGRAVAQSRQVRNQPGVPKQNRDGEIRRNRKHVPHQCAAEITAKSVIASAERLIEVRHFWRSKYRIAEISVPACPIPIQKTKLVMSHAQPTGT